MPTRISLLRFMFILGQQDSSQQVQPPEQNPDVVVSREPFDLKLKLPDGSGYEEHFDRVSYVKDGSVYRLQRGEDRRVMMLLIIESRLRQTLCMNASMQIPNRKGTHKTSILRVLGGKIGFESWPHPIIALELKNRRFSAKAPAN